eukprot:3547269-Amphidinium_carterae.1
MVSSGHWDADVLLSRASDPLTEHGCNATLCQIWQSEVPDVPLRMDTTKWEGVTALREANGGFHSGSNQSYQCTQKGS